MLVSILANLVMQGGIIPPTPTPHGGGEGMGGKRILSRDEELILNRKKILDQEEEDILIIFTNWIVTWITQND